MKELFEKLSQIRDKMAELSLQYKEVSDMIDEERANCLHKETYIVTGIPYGTEHCKHCHEYMGPE